MSEVCAVWAAGSSLGNRGPQLPGLSGRRLTRWTGLKSGLRIGLSSIQSQSQRKQRPSRAECFLKNPFVLLAPCPKKGVFFY